MRGQLGEREKGGTMDLGEVRGREPRSCLVAISPDQLAAVGAENSLPKGEHPSEKGKSGLLIFCPPGQDGEKGLDLFRNEVVN